MLSWLSHLHIGNEYPAIVQGIAQTTSDLLNDGFDLAGFKDHPDEFFNFDDNAGFSDNHGVTNGRRE